MNAPAPSGKTNNSKGRSRFPAGMTDKKSKYKGNSKCKDKSGMTGQKGKYKGNSKCKDKSRSFDFTTLRSG
jgi:hypothetical protein